MTHPQPWYAINARSLLETRRQGHMPPEPVMVSMISGDFADVAGTVLYARADMPVDRMDWRMLVNLEAWVWAGAQVPLDRITATLWHIASARPRELVLRFQAGERIHDINCGSGHHAQAVADLPPEHGFWWLPMNVGGTEIGARIVRALTAKYPKECVL